MEEAFSQYTFDWREGNRFDLFVDGEQFVPAMLQAIDGARHYIYLEIYLCESGRVADLFIEALLNASGRGVEVFLLLDAFGSLRLQSEDRARLLAGGIFFAVYNPMRFRQARANLLRDHRKVLLADGECAFVGGMGITDDFYSQGPRPSWHDVMVRVEGPCIADWEITFCRNWNLWSPLRIHPRQSHMQRLLQGVAGRVVLSNVRRTEIKRSLLKQMRQAERRIWISTAYFIPSLRLRRTLQKAAKRGVDVRLLLAGSQTDHPAVRLAGRRFYRRLLRHGVRIYEYQPRFLHAKMLLCDDWCSIGSSNLDRWNFRWNLEANQEILDPPFARRVAELFENDFCQSVEYTRKSWEERSLWGRLLERWWGWIDLWSDRLR